MIFNLHVEVTFEKAVSKTSWIIILQTNILIYDRSKLKNFEQNNITSKCYGKTADKVTWPMEIDSPWIILPRWCHHVRGDESFSSFVYIRRMKVKSGGGRGAKPKKFLFFHNFKLFKVSFNLCYQNSGQNWQ